MKQFIALYFLFLLILFTLLYADTSIVSTILNNTQTKLTLFLLNIFLDPGQLQGIDIWINPHYKIIINQACNGIIPILFLWASILAYPSTIWHKILWIVIGYILFTLVNVFRILLVVHFTEQQAGQANFYWSHDLLGNSILMLVGLGLFIAFIKTSSKNS
jgi:exosortase/archaeosortase family protein